MSRTPDTVTRSVTAGILGWILPGAGHFYLGHRKLATLFFCAITLPYLAGVAIGGVKTTVNPYLNRWLFLAEMGAGGLTTGFFAVSDRAGGISARETTDIIREQGSFLRHPPQQQLALQAKLEPYVCYFPFSDVAQIYLAVAGLLNILAILDALTRAQTGGLPVYFHELAPSTAGAGEGKPA